MGRAEAGSTKQIANAIKAKGLGRLRWYCQVCEKQCRDENGFQAHCRSEPHLRKILAFGPKAGHAISDFSKQFQYEFVTLLRTRHSTKRVRANTVYNEYIQDKHHVHMNATRWVTLSGFVQTLGKEGIVKVDEDDRGLWIEWIDTSPKTLAKQAALQKMERATMDGEERERKMLEDQISRARASVNVDAEDSAEAKGLQKKEGEKVTLNFGAPAQSGSAVGTGSLPDGSDGNKPMIKFGAIGSSLGSAAPGAGPSTSISLSSTPGPTVTNPLKRAAPVNVFKSAKASKTDDGKDGDRERGGKKFVSEAERLMKEEKAWKAARTASGYQGAGPRRGDARRY